MKNNGLNQILLAGLILSGACTAGAATERDLIAILQSNAGPVEKCAACQQLRIYGTAQSVAPLAALLGDERLGHAALYALDGLPYPEAGAALREALGRTSGPIEAGLIDSLGRRRDSAATPLLVPLLKDEDTAVAAASALGGIGDQAAAAALVAARDSRNPEVRQAVCQALLRCGDECLRRGDKAEASRIYRGVLEASPPMATRVAAWRGEVLSEDAQRTRLVLEALTGADEPLRLTAVRLVRETKDEQILKTCLGRWKSFGADVQAALIDTLAECEWGDRTLLPQIREACRSSEPAVRIAGLKALGVRGGAANVALLAERAARTSGDEQAAARASLRVLRGKDVHPTMIGRMREPDPAVQGELVQALADRGATEAIPVLLQMAAGDEASVRVASYRALRELAGAGEVETLVALLAGAPREERKQLENVILGVARRTDAAARTAQAILARLDSVADTPCKGTMIRILGQLGDASALATLRRTLSDADLEIRSAAIAGLGHWPDVTPLPDLLQVVRDDKNLAHRVLALRGYIDLVGRADSMRAEEKVQCCKTALDLAPTAAEKRRVFAVLTNVKTAESLQLAASGVQDEQAKEEAALAVVTIAKDVSAGNAGPVKAALGSVVAANVRNTTKEQARKMLDDIGAAQSYLMNWEVAGPYVEKGKNYSQLFDTPFEPEKPKAKVEWRKVPVSANGPHPAYCDLLKELKGGEQRVAYLRTQIEAEDLQAVTLEIFSDDGVKVWLNNKVIHSNNVARPIMPQPDRVTVTLQKGVNRLLLKVTQNNLPWGAIVRVREAKVAEPKVGAGFRLHIINADSRFEAAGVLDVNRDGKLDIFCGGFWYEAPDWKKHFVREIKEEGNYFYDFANLPMDVDGDGWVDIANAAWHNKMVFWERNPGKSDAPWEVFQIDTPGNMETALAFDINGDGQLDVLPNIMSAAAWYEYRRDASAPGGAKWEKHDLPKEGSGHGNGAGDINRDGRCDIISTKGWLEQTATGWQWHPEFELGHASVPILVHDVDRDGDSDVVWGLGHDYGLFWLEQVTKEGERTWERHLMDKSWSQPHFMVMADLDNDGQAELVTGKRYYAHNGNDPGENDPVCVYYYKFDVPTKSWTRHTIHEGGRVGFGINTAVVDIDADGDL
ncbi:MAG: HEAT repeat domain-containing protein, partial [Planctomycetes bacterium]|nr:HEAT repeat domain-containing protein [Planctomycetota bacterium]